MLRCHEAITHLSTHIRKEDDRKIYAIFLNKINKIRHIHNVLQIPYIATERLQRAGINLADAVGFWMIAICKLKETNEAFETTTGINVGRTLLKLMEKRFAEIWNPTAQLATFLDPRLRSILEKDRETSAETINLAICNICKIWKTIQEMSVKIQEKRVLQLPTPSEPPEVSSDRDCMNNFLRKCANAPAEQEQNSFSLWDDCSENIQPTMNYSKLTSTALILELRNYNESAKREDYDPNVSNYMLQYWKTRNNPDILEIVRLVSLIPPTQATVERTFSAVKFIFGDHRLCLCKRCSKQSQFYVNIKN